MHIGARIKEVFDRLPKDQDVRWLAARLHCDRRTVYRLFERDNIDIIMLQRVSRALSHDFFADLSASLPACAPK